jgi:hypothetical protein
MPWCDDCARFWNPTSMRSGGECPTCGRVIAEVDEVKAPWHFKLLVVATVLYLAFRAYQGIAWLIAR